MTGEAACLLPKRRYALLHLDPPPTSLSDSPPCLLSLTCQAHLRTLSPRAAIRAACCYAAQRADDEATAVDYRLNSKEAGKQLIKLKQLTSG